MSAPVGSSISRLSGACRQLWKAVRADDADDRFRAAVLGLIYLATEAFNASTWGSIIDNFWPAAERFWPEESRAFSEEEDDHNLRVELLPIEQVCSRLAETMSLLDCGAIPSWASRVAQDAYTAVVLLQVGCIASAAS
jgi:hypothetical protein